MSLRRKIIDLFLLIILTFLFRKRKERKIKSNPFNSRILFFFFRFILSILYNSLFEFNLVTQMGVHDEVRILFRILNYVSSNEENNR